MRKSIKMFCLLATIALSGVVSPVLADAAPAAPTVAVNGLVDTYYAYNFTYPGSFTTGAGYFYNSAANSFTLGLAEAKFTATQGQASGHLVLAYGQEIPLGLFTTAGFDVLQAYVTYSPSQWNFSAGRFVTWMGYEVIESSSNWNYSRSLLFGLLPFWHEGVSVNFAPDSTFGITVYDTDTLTNTPGVVASNDDGKTYGLQVALNPNSMWSITLNGMMSPIVGSLNTQSTLIGEGIVVYKPSSDLSLALDAQYGTQTVPSGAPLTPSIFGVALYGRYQIASDNAAALRLEYVNDSYNSYGLYANGAPTGKNNGFSAIEVTGTFEHDFTANLLGRLEARVDSASAQAGGNASNVFATGGTTPTSSSNITGTASAVMTF